jgi:hypothetical protein
MDDFSGHVRFRLRDVRADYVDRRLREMLRSCLLKAVGFREGSGNVYLVTDDAQRVGRGVWPWPSGEPISQKSV